MWNGLTGRRAIIDTSAYNLTLSKAFDRVAVPLRPGQVWGYQLKQKHSHFLFQEATRSAEHPLLDSQILLWLLFFWL